MPQLVELTRDGGWKFLLDIKYALYMIAVLLACILLVLICTYQYIMSRGSADVTTKEVLHEQAR